MARSKTIPFFVGLVLGATAMVAVSFSIWPRPISIPAPPTVAKTRLSSTDLERLKASTVFLEIEDQYGATFTGTGWFGIEPGLIVTNAHVIQMKRPGNPEPMKISVYIDSGIPGRQRLFEGQKIKILAVDRDMDLALLQVINEFDLPPPLPIRPSSELNELDRLVTLGFPGGRRLATRTRNSAPPLVSVGESSLSAKRPDDSGNIYSLQVQGGVVHGYSGGPVADLDGNVVGVAVRVDLDHNNQLTQIGYAVPSEYVTGLLEGRAIEAEFGQPYFQKDRVVYPLAVRCTDGKGRLKSVGIGTWLDDAKTGTRSGGDRRGESKTEREYREVTLQYDPKTQVAIGAIDFPRESEGRAFWFQVCYGNAAVDKRYLAGSPVPLTKPPVELESAKLIAKIEPGSSRMNIKRVCEMTETWEIDFRETVEPRRIEQSFRIGEVVGEDGIRQFPIDSYSLVAKRYDQAIELPKPIAELPEAAKKWDLRTGDPKEKVSSRAEVQIRQVLQDAFLNLPKREFEPGFNWKEVRTRNLLLDPAALAHKADELKGDPRWPEIREEMQSTYFGRRDAGGRNELVFEIAGTLTTTGTAEPKHCGRITGRFHLDSRTGLSLSWEVKREFDFDYSRAGTIHRLRGTETTTGARER